MKNVLIAFGVLALLSTAALVYVHNQNETELEKFHIHFPHHLPHIHVPKLHLKNIGGCLSTVYGAVSQCGAAYDSAGSNISGDIGCVKNILNAKKCGHIF
ncbi:hypothetical protein ABPG74_011560 [Tetrahymena malaccensis]